jgi:hypothetical protein
MENRDMTNKTFAFEIAGEPAKGEPAGVVSGHDINPADYLRLLDGLITVEWLGLKPEPVVTAYRQAVDELTAALKVLVSEVGTGKAAAAQVKDALADYAPEFEVTEPEPAIGVIAR